MLVDQPGSSKAILPLGVRLLAWVLIYTGLLGLLCVVVAALAMGLDFVPVWLVLGGLTIGVTAAGVGLHYGYAWPVTWLKMLLGLAVVVAIAVFAVEPLLVYVAGIQIALAGMVLVAPIHYLERPGVRAALRPPRTERVDRVPPLARRLASPLRSIGGIGLAAMGAFAAAAQAITYFQTSDGRDAAWALIGLFLVAELYAVPAIVVGIFIWLGSPGRVAVLIGLALSLMTAVQLGVAVGAVVIVPIGVSAALAVGLLAPSNVRRPATYSAFGSK